MQLQYSYIFQQIAPLICFSKNESVTVELEKTVVLQRGTKEIDLLIIGKKGTETYKIAIEMKCYRDIASSGGKRGASDIFMKDVYEDLQLLEQYCQHNHAHKGVSLVMTDLERFVSPKRKSGKCWAYDISNGSHFTGIHLNTRIGGKPVDIMLSKKYIFSWNKYGNFWFMELEGK